MAHRLKIVAIGGGGFTQQDHPELDLFCLEQAVARPRLGFIGAASGDDPTKIERFYDRFRGLGRWLSHLPIAATAPDAAAWLADLDLVYVGGGNTAGLIAHWRRTKIAPLMIEAARGGTVMAGVSAGGVCWFDHCLSTALGHGPRPLSGLGLIAGSACPHYSTEPERRPALRGYIAAGALPAGYALDDGAGLAIGPGGPIAVFATGEGNIYRVEPDAAAGWLETPILNAPPDDRR